MKVMKKDGQVYLCADDLLESINKHVDILNALDGKKATGTIVSLIEKFRDANPIGAEKHV